VLGLALFSGAARADDLTGRVGVGLDAGWGGRFGSKEAVDVAGNGAALGGFVQYGLTPNWRDGFDYDFVNLNGVHFTAITFNVGYFFFPDKTWTPFVELGAGGAKATNIPESHGAEPALSGKASVGVEYSLLPDLKASARATVQDADHSSSAIGHEVDVAVLGVGLGYWFGGAKPPAPVPVVAPAPVPEPVVAAPPPPPAPEPVAAAPAPPPAPKKVSISLEVQFEKEKDEVRPEFSGKIAEVATFLKAHPGVRAEIQGYTDDTGTTDYNTSLSQRRADSVRLYMIENYGVDGSSLTAKGYGSANPIADNATEEGRAKNRRVVTTIEAQE
jgi:OOP family OmpA-OmpF porin